MYTAKIENHNGTLTLTGNESKWQVVSITGLNPAPAQINLTDIASLDGAKFNSSKLATRNIVITIRLNGDVESNRLLLYSYASPKDEVTFYYKNSHLDTFIKGTVETNECNYFENGETMQISIICPFPYFSSLDEILTDISKEIPLFTFPFSIGDPIPFSEFVWDRTVEIMAESETGLLIEIDVADSVSDIKISKTTGEYIELTGAFLAGDRILINTQKGSKRVTLIRNFVESNAFSMVTTSSTLFQLTPGLNEFFYSVDSGTNDEDITIRFKYHNLYRGV